jgi:hypothetical protein
MGSYQISVNHHSPASPTQTPQNKRKKSFADLQVISSVWRTMNLYGIGEKPRPAQRAAFTASQFHSFTVQNQPNMDLK